MKHKCYACDLSSYNVWYLNKDKDGNILHSICQRCLDHIFRNKFFRSNTEKWAWLKLHNKGRSPPNKGKRADLSYRYCYACGSNETSVNKKTGLRKWWLNKDENGNEIHAICHKCGNKYFRNQEIRHRYGREYIHYKGTKIHLAYNPRTGFCSNCGNVGYTHLHHTEYDDSDPLKNIVELCAGCHSKVTWELGQHIKVRSYRNK